MMGPNEKQRQKNIIGLKCAACGSSNVYLEPYKYTQNENFKSVINLRRRKSRTFKIQVPICKECFKKFLVWKIYDKISLFLFVLSLLSVIIGIFFLFFYQLIGEEGVLLIGFGFLFIIISLGVRFLLGKINSNPNNYFFYDFLNEIFYLKPSREKSWIFYSSWIKDILKK
ncbi:MAG: hypothetical protein ACFE9N_06055 [Promethearchaeota archaeon]